MISFAAIGTFLANANDQIKNGANAACGSACNTSTSLPQFLGKIADIMVFLLGGVAVIMIILGGLRYVTSNGDAKAAAAGKDTILYAVIGMVVAIVSYAIVKFVFTNIK